MKRLGILPSLRRRAKLVGLGVLAAVAIALLATHRVSIAPPQLEARERGSGVARMQVLVDTPRTLIAASRVPGDDTIAARAALLGSLLASDDVRAEIAQGAGVDASELAVVNPDLGTPVIATPLSRDASEVSVPIQPNVVTVDAENPRTSVISVFAEASSPDAASRLAQSATAALSSLGSSDENRNRGVEITQLGPARVGRVAVGLNAAKALFVAIVAFGLWCAAVVLFDWTHRRRRMVSAPTNGRGSGRPGSRRSGLPAYPYRLNDGAPHRAGRPRR